MIFHMRYLDLKRKIQEIRINAIEGIAEAGSGHPGASFSAAEIMGVLYFRELHHNPSNPTWAGRDYFINSKDTLLQATMQRWQLLDIFQNTK